MSQIYSYICSFYHTELAAIAYKAFFNICRYLTWFWLKQPKLVMWFYNLYWTSFDAGKHEICFVYYQCNAILWHMTFVCPFSLLVCSLSCVCKMLRAFCVFVCCITTHVMRTLLFFWSSCCPFLSLTMSQIPNRQNFIWKLFHKSQSSGPSRFWRDKTLFREVSV